MGVFGRVGVFGVVGNRRWAPIRIGLGVTLRVGFGVTLRGLTGVEVPDPCDDLLLAVGVFGLVLEVTGVLGLRGDFVEDRLFDDELRRLLLLKLPVEPMRKKNSILFSRFVKKVYFKKNVVFLF